MRRLSLVGSKLISEMMQRRKMCGNQIQTNSKEDHIKVLNTTDLTTG